MLYYIVPRVALDLTGQMRRVGIEVDVMNI